MKFASMMAAVLFVCQAALAADEIPLNSSIESVSLFKNGLAVVRRSAEINGPGVYRLADALEPVHGTFWVEGDVPVDVQMTMREVDAPELPVIDFQQELVGHDVAIRFKQNGSTGVSGKIVALGRPTGGQAWDRQYQSSNYSYNQPQNSGSVYLVLDTGKSRIFVDSSEIALLECGSAGNTTRQRVPVLLLTPHGDKKGTIHISYLTKGIAWAPSYRVNLVDDKTLNIEQQAVIKNELQDFKDAEVSVISGYPSILYAHVVSPLALSQNWAQFFAQMSGSPAEYASALANAPMAQSASPSNGGAGGIDLSATPEGEGVDLHYQSLGKRTMNEGDSLLASVAQASGPYERIVEWTVPDSRDADGQFVQPSYNRNQQAEPDTAWDALKFKNPLPFAMTTAPAMIEDGGHFAGQQLSEWVNTGEEATLHITKALSIRTLAGEQEQQNAERSTTFIGGREFRKVNVVGTLEISNHRQQDVTMVIRRQFSGDLIKADGDPKQTLREEGVYSVNRRNELNWTFPIKAGEEKKLTYQYSVLIAN